MHPPQLSSSALLPPNSLPCLPPAGFLGMDQDLARSSCLALLHKQPRQVQLLAGASEQVRASPGQSHWACSVAPAGWGLGARTRTPLRPLPTSLALPCPSPSAVASASRLPSDSLGTRAPRAVAEGAGSPADGDVAELFVHCGRIHDRTLGRGCAQFSPLGSCSHDGSLRVEPL